MKKLFLIVAALLVAVSFSACSDDDDKDVSIVGTWQITHDEGWVEYSDGTRDDFNNDYPNDIDYYYWTYAFDDNGTCVRKSYSDHAEDDEKPDYFSYTINGETLTMTEKNGIFKMVYQIKKLSQSQLVLFRSGEDAYEKTEATETYKRVK